MNERDDRLAAAPHTHDDLADAPLTEQARVGAAHVRALAVPPRAGLLQIEPRTEGATGAAHDDDAYRPVKIECAEIVEQLVGQNGIERVERIGTVHRQPIHGALFLDEKRLVLRLGGGHGVLRKRLETQHYIANGAGKHANATLP